MILKKNLTSIQEMRASTFVLSLHETDNAEFQFEEIFSHCLSNQTHIFSCSICKVWHWLLLDLKKNGVKP
jgi:hypothetical protein